jgi:mannose-6-phosphate isomerase-like protein (cupin superfamily)
MHKLNPQDIPPFVAPHGESVQELGGHAAGGLLAHSLAYITLPPGKKSLKHYHPVAEESYYILSGAAEVFIDGETAALRPGDMVAIRAGQVHQIRNPHPEPLGFLAVCVPAWTPDCSVFVEDGA